MTIQTKYITLTDNSRRREIPCKIYEAKGDELGTIIFSHGLGGDCESYKYLGEFFAVHGIRSIHPTHLGIDSSLLKEKRPFQVLKEAAETRINLTNSPADVKFIIDEMGLDGIAVGGHSYGSYTALALSGQDLSKLGHELNFADARVKCSIAISPHAVLSSPAEAYDEIKIPVLHITGKKDDSPFRLLNPVDRRIPYDNISAGNQYLIIFEHADHMVFAAQRRGNKFSANDINIMKITCAASLEFLKKYLLGVNSELDTPEFLAKVTAHGIFEHK
jgi:predicted dienelactone hydrolase